MNKLTHADLANAAAREYDAGNLIAQNDARNYFYRKQCSPLCCAVGAAFTWDNLPDILSDAQDTMLNGIEDSETLFASEEAYNYACDLQDAHDKWGQVENGRIGGTHWCQFMDLVERYCDEPA